jgi:hypothetical protein
MLTGKLAIVVFLWTMFLSPDKTFAQDTIYWKPNITLKWGDFQEIPDSNSKYAAITRAGIKYHLSASNDSFNVEVSCFFLKSKSWSKSKTNEILLIHEQGHFDIAELFTRKLRKAFTEYKFNAPTVVKDIDNIFLLNKKERAEMNILYDIETNYSQNLQKQVLWNKKIIVELERCKKFAST